MVESTTTVELTSEPGAEHRSQADAAYAAIRAEILRNQLAPGEQVTEAQLGNRFGFGRAAVRAALIRLCHEELVQVIPRHGYAIAPITFTHVQDLFGVRLVVEPAVARLTVERADSRLIGELERLNAACRHAPDQEYDLAEQRRANKAFHNAIARASGNQRLASLAIGALEELDRVLYLPQLATVWERTEASFEEHKRIIDAIRIRDGRGAEQAAYDHIVPNQRGVIDALISSPGLRFINLLGV
jgi:DNA-binding GntR family transcriptional regulator